VLFTTTPIRVTKGCKVFGKGGSYELREIPESYKANLGHETAPLRHQNEHFSDESAQIST
jgi:hypothetical protein